MFSSIKKLISVLMAIAIIFSISTFCLPVASAAVEKTGTVNTQDTNLREKPSAASGVITKMGKGEQVNVLGSESGGWYKIEYQNKTGYSRADFIDVMITGLNDSAVIISDSEMIDQIGSSNVTATLAYNTQVTITGSFGSMYQIKAGDKSGFVTKVNIHKHRIIDINLKATINSSNVNFRKDSNTSGEVIEILKKGTAVTAESIQDKWIKISYSGKEGFISGNFITYSVPAGSHLTTLSTGMNCQAVFELQIALKKKGLFYPAANGVYGNATKEAVAKFQSTVNLGSDGIAGPQTLLLLMGTKTAGSLWNNYRASLPAQKPQKRGNVLLEDWFGDMENKVKKYSPFEVIDARTGIHWNMQRFGGWWHADVETMTKADTEAMTKAWGGTLDPTRRPVWVKIEDKYCAASLMGFVHNTDTISTNGMDGQICLHFRGSKIHESGHIDEAQQACVQEAFSKAAKLDAYIKAGKV